MKAYFAVILVGAFTLRFLTEYSVAVDALFLIGIPLFFFRKSPQELGFKDFLSGVKWGALTSVILLTLYYFVCSSLGSSGSLNLSFSLITSLFLVALSEETFFRGFFYSSFENEELIKGLLSKNNLISSVLFGVAHALIYYNPSMFKVFFPSLVMGWLYEKSGSILAPIIFHFFSDLLYQFVRCL